MLQVTISQPLFKLELLVTQCIYLSDLGLFKTVFSPIFEILVNTAVLTLEIFLQRKNGVVMQVGEIHFTIPRQKPNVHKLWFEKFNK